MNITDAEYQTLVRKGLVPFGPKATTPRAKGVEKPGHMNKTEAAYAAELELRRRAGEILWYQFEAIKLRLADKTFYTPDFAVMLASHEIQLHEVKGFWRDDARVKIKVAAKQFPFFFVAVSKRKDGWDTEVF